MRRILGKKKTLYHTLQKKKLKRTIYNIKIFFIKNTERKPRSFSPNQDLSTNSKNEASTSSTATTNQKLHGNNISTSSFIDL